MNLTNETRFSPFIFEAYGQWDELLNVVFCRGTFDLQADGKLTIAAKQQPVVLADQYRTEPLVSSVQVDTDLVPHKFAADITLNAIAHAPHGQPTGWHWLASEFSTPACCDCFLHKICENWANLFASLR